MRPMIERIIEKIEVDDEGCWIFTGATTRGYGSIQRGRAGEGTTLVHRATYEFYVGPIPDGLTIDHLCRKTRCCNPDHLEPVTNIENVRRAARANARTHCKKGHPFAGANLSRNGPYRRCLACHREHQREYRRKAQK